MKFLQYIILTILVVNGSLPLLDRYNIEISFVNHFLEQNSEDCEDDLSDELNEEGTSEDNLASPEKTLYQEPKPNEFTELDQVGESGYIALSIAPNFTRTTSPIQQVQQAKINQSILERIYFSKDNTDPILS